TFTLDTTWKFRDGATQWSYTTDGTAVASGDEWTIDWTPATVAPGLDAGPLSYSTLTPDPAARVLDRTGADLLTQHVVTLVNVSPGADVNALAALLNPLAPGITAESLQQDLNEANGAPITAITLRQDDFAPIEAQLSALSNVTLAPQTRLLATDKTLTSPALAGLAEQWQQRTDAASGWAVNAQTSAGPRRVGGQDAAPVA
ncbi:penicillin-binding protein, partial [Mycolicibacterium elephantis]